MGSTLARIAALRADAAALDATELYTAFIKEKPVESGIREVPGGTTVHYIQEHDTLAGIAVRYGMSEELYLSRKAIARSHSNALCDAFQL